jgi:hypothetical protein
MVQDREKISTGSNEEPINETIAGTGPGIEEVERIAEKLHSPTAERDTLPLEGE